ncbi:MAG: polysaccharide biosynthesis/export family protein [Hyphomicrobiaceae bacterium]
MFFALVCGIAGCAGSGPSGRDFLNAARSDTAQYAVVDINDANIDIVSRWHRPSLGAMFGDYRSPKLRRIGVGDTLRITIWEAGGTGIFSSPPLERVSAGAQPAAIPDQEVAKDGTIQVPFAGRVRVAGKTPQQIEALIVQRLTGKASQPQVLVTLSRNLTHSATVTGDVANGSRVALSARGDRVLDVIASAGGVRVPVHEAFIAVSRQGTTLSVPMQNILANPVENIYVRPGDVITVIRKPQSFTAVGATGRNAVIPFDAGDLTLEEAMGRAGGLLDDRADPTGVFVLRYEPVTLASNYRSVPPHLLRANAVPIVYRLDLKDPAALFRARRFAMRDKDILYVSTAPLSDLEKIARVFGQLAAPALTVRAVSR